MAKTRISQLKALADIISDYRAGSIPPRDSNLINDWLGQFPAVEQEPLLDALVHVLQKTYISKTDFKTFLEALASTDKLSPGSDPKTYWKSVNLLNIQKGGRSQREILSTFDEVLKTTHGFGTQETGSVGGHYVYLDDCVGTGSRVRADVCTWLESDAPKSIELHIITPVLYVGSYWIDQKIQETATAHGKTITLHKWRLDQFQMENRLARRNTSDVLWPTELPTDPAVQAYAVQLQNSGHPAILRDPGNVGASGIFQDDAQKMLLEQAFLRRGCQIRQECSNLPDKARPLGYHNLDCLGFGSMFVTYRNCPNNCPLALWVQQAEYPALFPRKTNTQTAIQNLVAELNQ